jgi:SAM-dependent methyltransferase
MNGDRARYLSERRPDVHQSRPWSPFGYVSAKLRRFIAELLAETAIPPGGRVVDYGCAESPYAGLLPTGAVYVGADIEGNPRADVILQPDGSVPLPDASVDVVLSTQVLEHVTDPGLYLAECTRLLRPGGSLVLTTHGIMFRHPDPEDYWRWTCDGLARIVRDAGLEVVEVRGTIGLLASAVMLFQWGAAVRMPGWLARPFIVVCQALMAAVDKVESEATKRNDALVLGVRAVRPTA